MYAYVHVYVCQYSAYQSFSMDEALLSINPNGRRQLVKMLITLLIKFCILIYFNIVQPLIRKTVTRLGIYNFHYAPAGPKITMPP